MKATSTAPLFIINFTFFNVYHILSCIFNLILLTVLTTKNLFLSPIRQYWHIKYIHLRPTVIHNHLYIHNPVYNTSCYVPIKYTVPSLEVWLQIAKTFRLSLDSWLLNTLPDLKTFPEMAALFQYLGEMDSKSIHEVELLLQKAALLVK